MGNPISDEELLAICWRRWNITPKKVSRDEWASPCPFCGGRDRFRVFQADSGYWCREGDGHCGAKGWLDNDRQHEYKPDPKWAEQQREREQAAREERKSLVKLWQASYRADYWKGWHAGLSDENREWYHARGITDEMIARHKLGYCAEKHVEVGDGKKIVLPAYTVPIFSPDDGSVINVHFRLIIPPELEKEVGGKYRYEYLKDQRLPAAAWYAKPHGESQFAIVVEGAFKAIVVYESFAKGRNLQVIGLPSASPHPFLIEEIGEHYKSEIFIWLDPGAHAAAERIADILKPLKTRLVTTAWKPDDAILYHSAGPESVRAWLKQGVPTYTVKRREKAQGGLYVGTRI